MEDKIISISYLNIHHKGNEPLYPKLTDVDVNTAFKLLKFIIFDLKSEASLSSTHLRIFSKDISSCSDVFM